MTTQWEQVYAGRVSRMEDSVIREILKVARQPGMISFAGGMPASELFPVEHLKEVTTRLLDEQGRDILQYSVTEGYPPLREMVAEELRAFGIPCAAENVLITSGSQQGIDLAGKVLIDPGDKILVEEPTYLGAMQSWNVYEPEYVGVETDEQGILPDALEAHLHSHAIKAMYAIPTFQNPSGVTTSLERREALVRIMDKHGVPVVEDNPYGELRYEGEPLPPLFVIDAQIRGENGGGPLEEGNVIYMGTFSKTLCPGFRVAWMVAPRRMIRQTVAAKQATDLHTSSFAQAVAYEAAKDGFVQEHIKTLVAVYRERRDLMLGLMDELFPREVTWTRPEGGMFIWVRVPDGIKTVDLLDEAVRQGVAFVPGFPFYPHGGGESHFRLSFSYAQPDQIEEGIKRLAAALKAKVVSVRTA